MLVVVGFDVHFTLQNQIVGFVYSGIYVPLLKPTQIISKHNNVRLLIVLIVLIRDVVIKTVTYVSRILFLLLDLLHFVHVDR